MNILRKGFDPTEIEKYQYGAHDQRTEATQLLENMWQQEALNEVHPWYASDTKVSIMHTLGVAIACDTTAEALLYNAAFKRFGKEYVDEDAGIFGLDLSRIAAGKMEEAAMMGGQNESLLTEETILNFSAERQIPYWPRAYKDEVPHARSWKGRDVGVVSLPFMRGIVSAGRQLEVAAVDNLRKLTQKAGIIPEPPEMYGDMPVISELLLKGGTLLEAGEEWFPADESEHRFPTRDSDEISRRYNRVHEGFIWMMNSFLASVTPPTLGPQFLPESD
jgi:hypothetical protein